MMLGIQVMLYLRICLNQIKSVFQPLLAIVDGRATLSSSVSVTLTYLTTVLIRFLPLLLLSVVTAAPFPLPPFPPFPLLLLTWQLVRPQFL